ncbi:MAG: nucleotidyltransferase family protein [Clostridia bacterium]|nr:nucleotidyltransferase family protein [Clostridia bacterium]
MNMLNLLKASLWGNDVTTVTREDFEEMKSQAVVSLPATVLSKIELDKELRRDRQKIILQQVGYNTNYIFQQENLPISVPYVILKGSAAAKYYPYPEFRTMGDIDIITRREDYETACREFLDSGCPELTETHQKEFGRHRSFLKNGVVIEVHLFFSLLNDPEKANYLDDLIINNINPSHFLPDPVNGLVLLEHISQHLEEGLGLRQIIDWMMFVDKYLKDNKWNKFREMAQKTGLETLAIVTTRMCEMYLGLPEHQWCKAVDETLCHKLMDYVLDSGNFGIKRNDESSVSINLLTYVRTPAAFFRLLQERGLVNWKATRKYGILKPFAWIYQLFRYQILSVKRKDVSEKMKKEYTISRERIALFDALGTKQVSKGLAVYENGEYTKTYKRP